VRDVLAYWADFRGLSLDQAADLTTENFFRLFPRARVCA
jgi:Tat protein secretion system quality control protein TatD with DNase activity